jgi:hypothetical protein
MAGNAEEPQGLIDVKAGARALVQASVTETMELKDVTAKNDESCGCNPVGRAAGNP